MKGRLSLSLLLASVSPFASAKDVDRILTCRGCSAAQMYDMASSIGSGNTFVVEPVTQNFRYYKVKVIRDLELPPSKSTFELTPPDAVARNVRRMLEAARKANLAATSPVPAGTLELPGTVDSAHDLVNEWPRTTVADALSRFLFSSALEAKDSATEFKGFMQKEMVGKAVVILFQDGTSYSYVIAGVGENLGGQLYLQINPVRGSGLDGGIRIPESGAGFDGVELNGNSTTIDRFIDTARSMGIPVIDKRPSGAGGGGGGGRMVCGKVSSDAGPPVVKCFQY